MRTLSPRPRISVGLCCYRSKKASCCAASLISNKKIEICSVVEPTLIQATVGLTRLVQQKYPHLLEETLMALEKHPLR